MKKKTEVYVKVDSAKVARKLAKTLKMFSEPVFFLSIERWEAGEVSHETNTGAILLNEQFQAQWAGTSNYRDRAEVSVKELHAILAAEHLKAGDVVVCKRERTHLIEVVAVEDVKGKGVLIWGKQAYCLESGNYDGTKGFMYLEDFKRYATEAEIGLLKGQELKTKKAKREPKEWSVTIKADVTVGGKRLDELTLVGTTEKPKAETMQEEGERIHRELFEKLTQIPEARLWIDEVSEITPEMWWSVRDRLFGESEKPKVEQLEDNTWYMFGGNQLVYRTVGSENFDHKGVISGEWRDGGLAIPGPESQNLKKATYEQVNAALLAEAQKRYKVGDVVKSLVLPCPPQCVVDTTRNAAPNAPIDRLFLQGEDNIIQVFKNGKWAEVVRKAEKPESAEKQVQPESKPESTVGRWVVVPIGKGRYDEDCTRSAVVLDDGGDYVSGFTFRGDYVNKYFRIRTSKDAGEPIREATPQDILEAIRYAETLK